MKPSKLINNLTAIFFIFCALINAQQIPILAFHGVQSAYTSEANFRILKDAGFNVNFTIYKTNDQAAEALDCAQITGVKILLYTDDLVRNPRETVMRFKNHPALFGYYIGDEPNVSDFVWINDRIKEIKKYDSTHPCYVNLYPNYALKSQLKANSYTDYISRYVNDVQVDFLSFDNYPLMNNVIHKDWYANLEMIRDLSNSSKKDFWAFANATIFGPYKQPTVASLKLQIYSNLLYGAQGLQYFTYWTLDDSNWRKNNFGNAIVNPFGIPTPTYEIVRRVNFDLQRYVHIFIGSSVTNIIHAENNLPELAKKSHSLPPNFKFFGIKDKIMLSYLTNGNYKYIIILNKNFVNATEVTMELEKQYEYLDSKDVEKSVKSGLQKFTILPGDILVIRY